MGTLQETNDGDISEADHRMSPSTSFTFRWDSAPLCWGRVWASDVIRQGRPGPTQVFASSLFVPLSSGQAAQEGVSAGTETPDQTHGDTETGRQDTPTLLSPWKRLRTHQTGRASSAARLTLLRINTFTLKGHTHTCSSSVCVCVCVRTGLSADNETTPHRREAPAWTWT